LMYDVTELTEHMAYSRLNVICFTI